MLFTQLSFIVFFALLLCLYWSVKGERLRILILTLASFCFYGAWDYRFLALLGGVILVTYIAQRKLFETKDDKSGRRIVTLAVIVLLGLLGLFKYFNFFVDSFVALGQSFGLRLHSSTLKIILPVGISFYIFQAIGFIVDVKRRDITSPKSLLDTAFFVAFFPQLVAGPIVRAQDFFPQIDVRKRFRELPFKGIILLFLGGFFKKAVLADSFALYIVDPVFAAPGEYSSAAIITAVFAYALQIYCDFSGYSDMAIATSRSFGYRLPVNFKAPYLASSITDFWRRWHISLSNWLRDYLYISLGGNRGGVAKTYRNLFLTMVLGGLWHGASWNFLFWGYLHGSALAVERVFDWPKKLKANRLLQVIGVAVTFYFTCICWVFFRSSSFDVSRYFVEVMLGRPAVGETGLSSMALLLLVGLFAIHAWVYIYRIGHRLIRLPLVYFCLLAGLALAAMLPFIPREAQPFIYFQF